MRLALLADPDNIHVRRWVGFLHSRGHELMVIADPHTSGRLEGVDVRTPRWNLATKALAFRLTPRPHGNALFKAIHYRPIIAGFRPDVVHGFEAYYNGLATAWAGPYPTVLTPWGNDVYDVGSKGGLGRWIVKRALRGVDRITTNDETMPDYLEREFGIPRRSVPAFSWGVDLNVFRAFGNRDGEAAGAWRRELVIDARAPVVFHPRNLHPYWGADAVVDAIGEVAASVPAAVFIMAAWEDRDGFRTKMKRRAEELGVAGSIRWIERFLSPAEMAQLYNLADVFISVPKTDLLASSVLEGMACGALPVVADRPAYRKHLRDGENALVVDDLSPAILGGAIARALGDRALLTRATEINVARIAEQEDAQVNMKKMEEVYAAAIESYAQRKRR